LVLNHDEKLGTTQKERFRKREDNLYIHIFKGGVVGVVGTCNRKP
jgi:hypothetical protein